MHLKSGSYFAYSTPLPLPTIILLWTQSLSICAAVKESVLQRMAEESYASRD